MRIRENKKRKEVKGKFKKYKKLGEVVISGDRKEEKGQNNTRVGGKGGTLVR